MAFGRLTVVEAMGDVIVGIVGGMQLALPHDEDMPQAPLWGKVSTCH